MGKAHVAISDRRRIRPGRMARESGREIYPDGLPRGIKSSDLEAMAGDPGIDGTGYSPRARRGMTYAGSTTSRTSGTPSSRPRSPTRRSDPGRSSGRSDGSAGGGIDRRDAAAAEPRQLPLRERDAVADPDRLRPAVAMVSMDGGRLRVRSGIEPQSKPTSIRVPTT